jgi:hypothetical protein
LGVVVDGLVADLDRLLAVDVTEVGDEELSAAAVRVMEARSKFEAAACRVVGAWRDRALHTSDGSRSAAARLGRDARCAKAGAARVLRLAGDLGSMPLTAAALAAGEISADHARLLGELNTGARQEVFARDEAHLLALARTLDFEEFVQALRYWRWAADDSIQGCDPEAEAKRQHVQRYLRIVRTFDGCWDIRGLLDPITGEIVATALARIEQELFEADCRAAEAAKRAERARAAGPAGDPGVPDPGATGAGSTGVGANGTGDGYGDGAPNDGHGDGHPRGEQDGPGADRVKVTAVEIAAIRTGAQRCADAFVELCTRAQTVPAGGVRPRPLLSLVVGLGDLMGPIRESFNGTVFTPGQIAGLLTEADIERIVFDPPSRVIDVSRTRRLFTGALRRAVEVRDRHCQFPGCTVPAEFCQVDHIVEVTDGGPTVQENGRLLCPAHNRQRPGRRSGGPPLADTG